MKINQSNKSLRHKYSEKAGVGAFILLLLIGACSQQAEAVTTRYGDYSGTFTFCDDRFTDSDCWSNGIPRAGDTALFDQFGSYSVSSFGGASSASAIVKNGFVNWYLNGATYTLSDSLIVGQSSGNNAKLTLFSGTVSSVNGFIGLGSGSTGTVEVNGGSGLWNNSGDLSIGADGTGTLTMRNGGSVTVGGNIVNGLGTSTINIYSGSLSVGGGLIDVDNFNISASGATTASHSVGVGESLISNTLTVGDSGAGTLDITAGGTVTSNIVKIGDGSDAVGTVNVSGSGSTWQASSIQTLGLTNTLNISNGATVTMNGGGVYDSSQGTTTITVNGSGSRLVASGGIGISNGVGGTGLLTIEDGGRVFSQSGSIATRNSANVGTVIVDGIDSEWYMSGSLSIATKGLGSGAGTGTVILRNGGRLRASSITDGEGSSRIYIDGGILSASSIGVDIFRIGNEVGSLGSHTVGAGKSLTTLAVDVGYDGTGTLNIEAGGVVTSDTGYVGRFTGADGTAIISGIGSNWSNNGNFTLGLYSSGTLTIADGGSLDSNVSYVGYGYVGNGAATVSGLGSSWTNLSNLFVGYAGTGSLNVDNGGLVSNVSTYVGFGDSEGSGSIGSGLVSVSGAGSTLTNTGNLYVGVGGAGTLSIDGGGSVTNTIGYLGGSDPSVLATGIATVSGVGSEWLNSGTLYVGETGFGTLNIDAGGLVSNTRGTLGYSNGSSGTANVSGANTTWLNQGELRIGEAGTGTLNVNNAGSVYSIDSFLGHAIGSTGAATVSGADSQWYQIVGGDFGDLNVGYSGQGNLNIENGGLVVTGKSGYVGYNASGNGDVSVSGTDSLWNIFDDLFVGYNGTGTLNIDNGGEVFNNGGVACIGCLAGSAGTVTLSSGGELNVGRIDISDVAGSTGNVTVNVGGTLSASGTVAINSGGTLTVNGGTVNMQTLESNGVFNFYSGTLGFTNDLLLNATHPLGTNLSLNGFKTLSVAGTTTLDGFNTLSIDGGTFSTGSLVNNAGFAFNSGTFNLTNDNLTIGSGGLLGSVVPLAYGKTVNVTNTTTVDSAGLLYLNGGSFSAGNIINNGQIEFDSSLSNLGGALSNNGLLNGSGRVSAVLTNNAGGEVQVSSGDTLRFTATGNTNSGDITLAGGTARFEQDLTNTASGVISGRGILYATGGLTNQGSVNLSAGTTDVHGAVNNDTGGTIIVSGNSTTTFYDDVINNGDELRVSTGSTAVFFGEYSGGMGTTGGGLVQFEGGLSIGNSPALASFETDIVFGANSENLFEIGGFERGLEYDAIDVDGALTFDGLLEVTLYDLGEGIFDVSAGDSFDLIYAETFTGEFDLLTLFALDSDLAWQLDYLIDEFNTTDVLRLTAVSSVPVPAAVWLFGSGLLGLVGVARRKI